MEQRRQLRHGRRAGITTREECLAVERAGRQPRYNQGEESTRFNALTIQQFNGFS
jgi:hypothetical protein